MGTDTVEVEVREGQTYRDLLLSIASKNSKARRALDLLNWRVAVIVDGRVVDLDEKVEGESIHILPPPSGGSKLIVAILGKDQEIDLNGIIREVASSPNVGGIGVFVGIVRGVNQGEEVEKLSYEHSRELAVKTLEKIAREEAEKHSLDGVFIGHYVGDLRPGDETLIVAVAGESRRNVYPALSSIVERVKKEAPIWKTEYRRGGKKVYILGDKYIEESMLKISE
ncbi:MAG: molybdenum cofactor biosynthesis protein MoaE [Desulfurococcales archaeon]|nr:molybdenum cofactor biosynthesis protein MoaE [Desulfurococcales archaeon]